VGGERFRGVFVIGGFQGDGKKLRRLARKGRELKGKLGIFAGAICWNGLGLQKKACKEGRQLVEELEVLSGEARGLRR